MSWFHAFVDLILPRTCISCTTKLLKNEKYVCLNCLTDLAFLHDYKQLKDNKIYYQIAGLVPIQGAFAGFRFDKGGKLQKLIHHLKYYQKPQIGIILGEYLASRIDNPFPKNSILIPIPLHRQKLKKRGYNQAAKIAQGLSNIWKIELFEQGLVRTKFTETQTFKSKVERQKNVENIFEVTQTIKRPIVLVDDVITTGATLISASRTLKNHNIKDIYIVTLAAANY